MPKIANRNMGARLDGKVALITGAASGIGAAIAFELKRRGATAIAGDLNLPADGAMPAIRLNVSDDGSWRDAMAWTESNFGGVDLLINNAGVTLPGSIEDISLEDWRRTLDVDLTGVFLGCRHGIAAMRRRGGGAIVNISSAYGLRADPDYVAYNAAKSALVLMTKSIALHCARERIGIRCNVVHPGVIRTAMFDEAIARAPDPEGAERLWAERHPVGHLGAPRDIAAMVAFLLSDDAAFATGGSFVVDGGLSL